MKTKIFLITILVSYFATLLRFFIDNNYIVSIFGSFLFGVVVGRKIDISKKEIFLSGFCACFTSFSGFLNFLMHFIYNRDFIQLFLNLNLIIVLNLLMMYSGTWLSRKMN